jgi:dihydrolipoamide dehydrogenase
MKNFDLCIIGAGPGGYVAAIRAAQLGLKVGIIESNHLGGICLNWGCIPTKALLRSAEIYHNIKNAKDFGIEVGEVKINFNKIIERSRGVAQKLSSGISHLMKKNKIEVIKGFAKIEGKEEIGVFVDNKKIETVKSKNIILATGAKAKEIPNIDFSSENIWTYKKAMTPEKLPKSIVVIGSGAIGIEFASFYRNLGVEVSVVEMASNILPVEDEEISRLARKDFEKQGIKFHTQTALKKIFDKKSQVEIIAENKGKEIKLSAQKAIIAIGISPNIENIGLEKTKIQKDERGFIKTDEFLKTAEDNIYAIGDIIAGPWLAHKASHEGVIAVEKISQKLGKYTGNIKPIIKENIPGCTYSMPQVASVGLTEKKAKEQGLEIKVGRFPYVGNGKAIAMGETEGLIKTIFDKKTGELLGAHLIGAEVTEMIQGYVIGKQAELVDDDFVHTIFAHPTMSEMMHEAVLDADKKAIHF